MCLGTHTGLEIAMRFCCKHLTALRFSTWSLGGSARSQHSTMSFVFIYFIGGATSNL